MQHLVFLPALLGTFCFLGNTLFGQSGIDIGLFNTPANSDRLEVRIRPTQTITNGIYSAGIFTVRVPATAGISITAPAALNAALYGYALVDQGTDSLYDYYVFGFVHLYTVQWIAGTEYPLAVLQFNAHCGGLASFEIINNTWTAAHNGDHYHEVNTQEVQNIIWQASVMVVPASCNLTLAGKVATEAQAALDEVLINVVGAGMGVPTYNLHHLSNGAYSFLNAIPLASNITITPAKDDNPLNGVSTYDLALISKHILGLDTLDSPYRLLAADANKSGSITTFDMIELRKLILGIYPKLPGNTSWRFVDASHTFSNLANPFAGSIPEHRKVSNVLTDQLYEDFVALKVGDVNGSALANAMAPGDNRTTGSLVFHIADKRVRTGEIFTVRFQAAEKVQGYQFTISLQDLEVVDLLPGTGMYLDNFGLFGDAITTSFDGDQPGGFEVTFRALAAGLLSTKLGVSSHITKAEAYRAAQERSHITFQFNQDTQPTEATAGFQLYQNLPNPFIERTNICFQLPEAAATTLTIFDAAGRIIWRHSADLRKGDHCFELEAAAFETTGLFYYQIKTPAHTAGRKMFFIR